MDRILAEFSRRYFDCNPNSIFGNASVVHQVAYSLLLLNTDLHVAELSSHMSRNQFVRNTMAALTPERQQSVADSDSLGASLNNDSSADQSGVSRAPSGDGDSSTAPRPHSKRSGSLQSWNSGSREAILPGAPLVSTPTSGINGSSSSLQSKQLESAVTETPAAAADTPTQSSTASSWTPGRNWEAEVEAVLKVCWSFRTLVYHH